MLIASVAQDSNATNNSNKVRKYVRLIRVGVPFRLTNDFCSSKVQSGKKKTSKHPSSRDSKLNLCIALVKVKPTNWTLPLTVPR